VQVAELAVAAVNLSKEQFLQKYPDSVLILEPFGEETLPPNAETPDRSDIKVFARKKTPTRLDIGVFELNPRNPDPSEKSLIFLRRKEGQVYVTLGRASDNDIIIPAPTISKHHVRFMQMPQGYWCIEDRSSRNLTYLDRDRLSPGQPYPLYNGQEIFFGREISATYYRADGLWNLISQE
jgi:pSer/pThr/pTyr-binding forkhead associated (FHA) protein